MLEITPVTTIPFNTLSLSRRNVRATQGARNIEALASSILHQGLLQNLVVTGSENAVVAGGRRFRALALLVDQNKIPADYPVPVKIVSEEASTSSSLVENVSREAMHPADEFNAFEQLTKEGWSIDRIADAFGVTPLVVERRLRLATAAPALIDEFRVDKITSDQLIALCTTEDHARQVEVWESARRVTYQSTPSALRKAIVGSQIDASDDSRVKFIGGVDAYVHAGGTMRRDLFSDAGQGGFLEDHGLLDQLVHARLEEQAAALRAEGWGWVEVWPQVDHTAFSRLGRAPSLRKALSADVQNRIDALNLEREALENESDALQDAENVGGSDSGSRLEEIWERQQGIEEEIERIEAAAVPYAAEVMHKSGALIIYQDGEARIERGLVRTADRQAVARAAGDEGSVVGGRESEPAGRKPDELSDALRRSLLGHRNLAAQMEAATHAHAAKVLMACWTVLRIRSTGSGFMRGSVPTDLTLGEDFSGKGTRTRHPISDAEGLGKANKWAKQCAERVSRFPKAEDALWDALAALKPAELDGVIAYGVALSVSLDSEGKGLTGKFLAAVEVDMAKHFTPTADNYLARVSKPLIIEALVEAGKIDGNAEKGELGGMKKSELAALAEKRLAGSGWVPAVMRTRRTEKRKATKKTKTKR
jgi:ParB family chromosome partitioning protein